MLQAKVGRMNLFNEEFKMCRLPYFKEYLKTRLINGYKTQK